MPRRHTGARRTGARVTVSVLTVIALVGGAGVLMTPGTAAQTSLPTPRLYILDCGRLEGRNLDRYNHPPEPRSVSVSCILVVHQNGTLLWDTGLGDRFVGGRETPTDPGWRITQSLRAQLTAIGHPPEDIDYVAISHMHADHTGNANDYAGATWIVQRAELEAAFGDDLDTTPYRALQDSRKIVLDNADRDVFGDGTVVVKSTPGHTPGHQSLFVRLAHTGPIVLTGDLYHYPEERWFEQVPNFEFDADQTRASRAKIEAFLRETEARLWIQHDIFTDRTLRKSPKFYD